MHLAPTDRWQRLCAALRTYFRELMPDGPPPADDGARRRALLRRIGADGLLGLGRPVAHGGQGRGIETVGGLTTTAAYHDGATVPAANLVGEENGGRRLITSQLNHERVALAALGMQAEDFCAAALGAAGTPDPVTGRRRIDEPWVRFRLAEVHARLAANRLLGWRLVGDVGAGRLAPGDVGGVKFAEVESTVTTYRLCQEIVGERMLVRAGSPGVLGDGEPERPNRAAQINTFGGGVSKVQREVVATMRLGTRRGRR